LFGVIPLRDLISEIKSQPTIKWLDGAPGTPRSAKLDWVQKLSRELAPFYPGPSTIRLEVLSTIVNNMPVMQTKGEIDGFALEIPSRESPLVKLKFNYVRFEANSGSRINFTFDLAKAELAGKLNFVKTLAEHIPQAGRGGPRIDISPTQIKAMYTIAVPTVPMGVFTLQNLLVEIGLTLSLTDEPIAIEFAFAKRERPFLVTVSGFGGGGYLELAVGAGGGDGGLRRLVGGIEFGASVAMDFGVAAGEVHVFGGIVLVKEAQGIEITGYLRIGGSVRVLFITVSVELTLALTYSEANNELSGSAKLVITVDLTFWSTSVTLRCHKSFKGPSLIAGGDTAAITSVEAALGAEGSAFPWQTYCRAFA
jgi:hypothetical protein